MLCLCHSFKPVEEIQAKKNLQQSGCIKTGRMRRLFIKRSRKGSELCSGLKAGGRIPSALAIPHPAPMEFS